MTNIKTILSTLLASLAMVGCVAAMVPSSNNPYAKLNEAQYLYEKSNRPLPAEKLIQQAIEILQNDNNQIGLAEAYRQYGFFFRSLSVMSYQDYYMKNGFLDKSASYQTRMEKSLEYFEMAKKIDTENKKFDSVANIYYNIGVDYALMKNMEVSCRSLDQ
jgi:tetratricopeptide (TPR) repeat protein